MIAPYSVPASASVSSSVMGRGFPAWQVWHHMFTRSGPDGSVADWVLTAAGWRRRPRPRGV